MIGADGRRQEGRLDRVATVDRHAGLDDRLPCRFTQKPRSQKGRDTSDKCSKAHGSREPASIRMDALFVNARCDAGRHFSAKSGKLTSH